MKNDRKPRFSRLREQLVVCFGPPCDSPRNGALAALAPRPEKQRKKRLLGPNLRPETPRKGAKQVRFLEIFMDFHGFSWIFASFRAKSRLLEADVLRQLAAEPLLHLRHEQPSAPSARGARDEQPLPRAGVRQSGLEGDEVYIRS